MSRGHLDFAAVIENDMRIGWQPAHGLLERVLGPEPLSHEALKQTLDPARVALDTEPLSHEAVQQMLDPARVALGPEPPRTRS